LLSTADTDKAFAFTPFHYFRHRLHAGFRQRLIRFPLLPASYIAIDIALLLLRCAAISPAAADIFMYLFSSQPISHFISACH
jgi:hypothetical protein